MPFRRSRAKVLVGACVLVATFAGTLVVVEHYLKHSEEGHITQIGIDRYVRLRELSPGHSERYYARRLGRVVELNVDADGYIVPSRIHENPDLTLGFLGGSTTECVIVEPHRRFPHYVGKLIERETGLKTNSLNSGVSGNDSMHSLNIFLNKMRYERPAFVVMMHNLNDLTFLMQARDYRGELGSRTSLVNASTDPASSLINIRDKNWARLFRHVIRGVKHLTFPYTWEALLRWWGGPQRTAAPGDIPSPVPATPLLERKPYVYDRAGILAAFERNLVLFVSMTRSAGAVPVLMTQASRYRTDLSLDSALRNPTPLPDEEFWSLYDSFNEGIRKIARQNDVVLIDLAREVPSSWQTMYDAVHYTDEGSVMAGEIIARKLIPLVRAWARDNAVSPSAAAQTGK